MRIGPKWYDLSAGQGPPRGKARQGCHKWCTTGHADNLWSSTVSGDLVRCCQRPLFWLGTCTAAESDNHRIKSSDSETCSCSFKAPSSLINFSSPDFFSASTFCCSRLFICFYTLPVISRHISTFIFYDSYHMPNMEHSMSEWVSKQGLISGTTQYGSFHRWPLIHT